MRRTLVISWLLFGFMYGRAQDMVERFSTSMCNCVAQHKALSDSEVFKYCLVSAATETEGLPHNKAKIEQLMKDAHFYMMKSCSAYIDFVNRMVPQKGDWVRLDSNLTSKLDSVQSRQLCNHNQLYYLEQNGNKTMLTIKDGTWRDSFQDGKYYSQCSFTWTSPSDFVLEYQKSNDPLRSKLSKKGDKYYYRVIDTASNYYLVTANYGPIYQLFKIYYVD